MANENDSLKAISDIRKMMERSSKFLSLSGLSGISAGVAALVGAWAAYMRLSEGSLEPQKITNSQELHEILPFLVVDGLLVLATALIFGFFFTMRKAQKQELSVWNATSQRLLGSLAIPLITGGLFCLAMIFRYHLLWIVFPATLIFYGLALLNGSKYTLRDVEYLGISEIVLGLLALFFPHNNLLLWAIGFGVLHIVYGTMMYYKYDQK